ncbi:ferritin-like domain-containing protein [Paenibacillus albiflavus]|uniref:Ferritin-like domain-containing protein n=1 Tax=Paenibacillus albiflavus TaxID=2545760 RepID=A0A4R4EG47_9BACL|nr:ferritin-like domain-containing protein [Paenibacillus albiflavus]TCZ77095.1 ferritin-like domain-containing protein [Paenibacillus albiflavus]
MIPSYPPSHYSYQQRNCYGYISPNQEMIPYMILQSISGERSDELFYQQLIQLAPTENEKKIIAGIRDDERKHNQMFRNIYQQLTCTIPNVSESMEEQGETVTNYLEGIEKALFGELKAFEKYRTIFFNIQPQFRDMIFEIMTDEIKHASYYNYLFAKNK